MKNINGERFMKWHQGLCRNILKARKAAGISAGEVAKACGLSEKTYTQREQGISKGEFNTSQLIKLGELFGVQPSELMPNMEEV